MSTVASRSQIVTGLPPAANRYRTDHALQAILKRHASTDSREWADPLLDLTGQDAAVRLDELSALANRYPPVLHTRDRFGNRVDRLEFHPAYDELRRASYGRGIVGHYHDPEVRRILGADREVVKFAQGYLFSQAEQGLYCPICLTDGASYLVERYGSEDQRRRWIPRLAATDLDHLWEGAMFLTERAGGSDVGASETVARQEADGTWTLHGEKWFCSNARAELAMVLARPEGAAEGTRGLGLFAMRRHLDDGSLNGHRLDRLKDKLGTRSMPTGEMVLEGAVAEPVGDLSRGFVQMADMLNTSRLYNSVAALAVSRRALSDALAWCRGRHAFARTLETFPAVRETLVERLVELEAGMHLVFSALARRGRVLVGEGTAEDTALLRMLTPLAKYATARLAVRTVCEAMELLGGNGYMEDWALPRLTRDALVLPIWEGTANILVLDTFRAIRKEQAEASLFAALARSSEPRVGEALLRLQESLPRVAAEVARDGGSPHAGRWCDLAVEAWCAAELADAATDARSSAVAENWLLRHLHPNRHGLFPAHTVHAQENFGLLTS